MVDYRRYWLGWVGFTLKYSGRFFKIKILWQRLRQVDGGLCDLSLCSVSSLTSKFGDETLGTGRSKISQSSQNKKIKLCGMLMYQIKDTASSGSLG